MCHWRRALAINPNVATGSDGSVVRLVDSGNAFLQCAFEDQMMLKILTSGDSESLVAEVGRDLVQVRYSSAARGPPGILMRTMKLPCLVVPGPFCSARASAATADTVALRKGVLRTRIRLQNLAHC
jgi:hypothetical protein